MGEGGPPRAAFICTDALAKGAEVSAPVDAPTKDVVTLAVEACGGWDGVDWVEEELVHGNPTFVANHVHQTNLTAGLCWEDRVPEHLFFSIERTGGSEETLVVGISVRGFHFRGRNPELEARASCVAGLLGHMNKEFGEPEYQQKLSLAKDRSKVQALIRTVHLKVLPMYGFCLRGADEERVLELVLQMQGFIQSGLVSQEARAASELSLVRSGYQKMLTLPSGLKAWSDRHNAAASDFRELLLRMRREGACRFRDGMTGLWTAAMQPQGCSGSPFSRVANRRLLSFGNMAEALCRDAAGIMEDEQEEEVTQADALEGLVGALGDLLDKPVLHPVVQSLFGMEPGQLDVWPFGGRRSVLLLVWLPLAFYVRNTSHLYEMLERLQLRAPHMEGAFQADGFADGAELLRAMLNRDARHYAYLVYAVMGAFQAMRSACERLAWRDPLALLGSSPPGNCVNGYPMTPPGEWPDSQLIFRGIWVGPEIDEERARFQYSFQSFSRDLVGMATVLSFYAGIGGSATQKIANAHRRVLIFVARAWWTREDFVALPVQLFDGPQHSDSEREVLLPPYVQYKLEDDLPLCSGDFAWGGAPSKAAAERLEKLRRRWPGFELPDLLLRMLRRENPPEFAGLLYQHMNPFISVRFIHKVVLPLSLQPLFKDRALQLYDFGCL